MERAAPCPQAQQKAVVRGLVVTRVRTHGVEAARSVRGTMPYSCNLTWRSPARIPPT
jgi:hypothetical protein